MHPKYRNCTIAPQQDFGVGELPGAGASVSVAAVVVLYYPNKAQVTRLIDSVASQVERIYVVDNTPSWDSNMPDTLARIPHKIDYRANGFNAGLASAQNAGISSAVQEGHTHVLLLDQDSYLPEHAVEGLLAAERSLLCSGTEVAAVGPVFIDEKSGQRSHAVRHSGLRVRWHVISPEQTEPMETDYLIASGSLIRSSVLKRVGLMRDELFIDWVDAEWSYRARNFGLAAYVIPTVEMKHNVGDDTGNFMGRPINLHNPVRNYYIVRNAVYLMQNRRMSWRWRVTMLMYIPKYILVHSWLSRNRWISFMQMLGGLRDGVTRTMKPFTAI